MIFKICWPTQIWKINVLQSSFLTWPCDWPLFFILSLSPLNLSSCLYPSFKKENLYALFFHLFPSLTLHTIYIILTFSFSFLFFQLNSHFLSLLINKIFLAFLSVELGEEKSRRWVTVIQNGLSKIMGQHSSSKHKIYE